MSITAMSDGEAIEPWAEVDLAERKPMRFAIAAPASIKTLGATQTLRARCNSHMLIPPDWLLCDTCHIYAMVAGWRTAPLDSNAGREALATNSKTAA